MPSSDSELSPLSSDSEADSTELMVEADNVPAFEKEATKMNEIVCDFDREAFVLVNNRYRALMLSTKKINKSCTASIWFSDPILLVVLFDWIKQKVHFKALLYNAMDMNKNVIQAQHLSKHPERPYNKDDILKQAFRSGVISFVDEIIPQFLNRSFTDPIQWFFKLVSLIGTSVATMHPIAIYDVDTPILSPVLGLSFFHYPHDLQHPGLHLVAVPVGAPYVIFEDTLAKIDFNVQSAHQFSKMSMSQLQKKNKKEQKKMMRNSDKKDK